MKIPHHVQIAQREQHVELRIDLGQAAVARIFVLEEVLDDMERVFDIRKNLCFLSLVGQPIEHLRGWRHDIASLIRWPPA